MAAGAAQSQRRIAAPVEKQQRLLTPLHRVLNRFRQRRRDEPPARRRRAAQVDGLDLRHVLAAEPRRQRHARIAPLARVHLGFDRRRRGGQHDGNLRDVRTHHRHVAGVIMHAVALLIGLVVLFIDDDQTKIRIGQKQRRARADHDMRFAGRDRRPVARAGARRQFRMPLDRFHAEALREAVEELPGQRDLRHQDQHLLATPHRLRHRLEIHFGLAGSGDAVEQRHRERLARRHLAQRLRGDLLIGREIRLHECRIRRRRRRRLRQRLHRQGALVHEAIDHADADAGLARRIRLAVQEAVAEAFDDAAARGRHSLRRRPDQPHAGAHALGSQMLAHPQRHAQHHAARRQRVIGDPIHQRAQFRAQRRHLDLLGDILEPVMQARIGIVILRPHHRRHLARAERNADDIAGLQVEPARHAIGIGAVERHRHQHIDDARAGRRCLGR